ncbi:MAG: FecR family protein [candidate division KSB1 bacterium]|nr:FecR family protein [candidate division KSB1 bacterium]MDZ7275144.1 FecR family protein [candidate division KSB1 bacterium]MDZ7287313.1 FecR family protein [candidate division KSB1 bacterium]MDZ7299427.1 FecR family protein [candidate division KSB1 bacterium]MDZ7308735.1 FecR family protein [candidate division KSB1 bacterium]
MKCSAVFGALVLLVCSIGVAIAQSAAEVAVVLKARGKVDVQRAQSQPAESARQGMRLHSGNLLRTGEESLAALVFTDDKSILKVRSNSRVAIKGAREHNSVIKTIGLEFGQLWARVTKSTTPFRIQTPSGVAAVKGTIFYCMLDESGRMSVICLEGAVELANALGKVLVQAGYTGTALKNQAPAARPSLPEEIPSWGNDEGSGGSFEIEFEDASGQKKRLRVTYE